MLRLLNESPTTRVVRVAVGDVTVTEVSIPGNGATRTDLSLQTDGVPSAGQSLTLSSDGSEWLLTSLEIANIHGFWRGLFEFVVTPASATASDRPGVLRSLTVFTVLLLLPGISGSPFTNRYVRLVHRALTSFVLLFLVSVIVVPWLSDFGVLIAGHTFVLCMAVIYALVLTRVARIVIRVATETPSWMRAHVWPRRILLLYIAALVLFVTSIAALYDPEHGMTVLIRFGGDVEEPVLPSVRAVPRYVVEDSFGYDGQFYAQTAVDPFLRDPALGEALDSPSYRALRILFSWTAYLLGLGQPRWVLQAYAIKYVVYWLLLAWVLCRWFPPTNLRNLGRWFGCMFGHGAIISVVAALPDGPSMLLLALSIMAIEAGHARRSAGLIGIAGLAKDVNLFWSPMLLAPGSLKRTGWRGLLVWGLLVTGPLSLWMLSVAGHFDIEGIGGGRNFAAPLASYFENWSVTLAALRDEGCGVPPSSVALRFRVRW